MPEMKSETILEMVEADEFQEAAEVKEAKEEKKMRKTFYGTKSANTCAYCYYHHKSLTPQQLKTRKCLEKRCDRLKVFETHPYMQQRAAKKDQRRQRKQALERKYLEATHQLVI